MTRASTLTLGTAVAEHGRRMKLASGRVLFRQGDESDSVYVCLSGRVRIHATTTSGRELIFGDKTAGMVFGELSAIDGRPRSAHAMACEPSEVAVLAADEFLDVLERFPALALSVLRELSELLRRSNARLEARDADRVQVRVGQLLVDLAAQVLRHGARDGTAVLMVSQDDLAGWVGATREATARALAGYRRAGLIETARGRIVVFDIDALATGVRTA